MRWVWRALGALLCDVGAHDLYCVGKPAIGVPFDIHVCTRCHRAFHYYYVPSMIWFEPGYMRRLPFTWRRLK
jgi:hypothetical protein